MFNTLDIPIKHDRACKSINKTKYPHQPPYQRCAAIIAVSWGVSDKMPIV